MNTPRTDAESEEVCTWDNEIRLVVPVGLARDLERELASCNEALAAARAALKERERELQQEEEEAEAAMTLLRKRTEERDAARAELANLRNDWSALQHAIVGDTGASAMLTVERMRAELERARKVVDAALKFDTAEGEQEIRWTSLDLATALEDWEAAR